MPASYGIPRGGVGYRGSGGDAGGGWLHLVAVGARSAYGALVCAPRDTVLRSSSLTMAVALCRGWCC